MQAECLKIYEVPTGGGCAGWAAVHLGVCRGDTNAFTLNASAGGGRVQSRLCPGKCLGRLAGRSVGAVDCGTAAAAGWSLERAGAA